MNWTERLFFAVVLLAGVGVLLFSLNALGVDLPFFGAAPGAGGSAGSFDGDSSFPDDLSPPERPEDADEEGLLAELEADPDPLDGGDRVFDTPEFPGAGEDPGTGGDPTGGVSTGGGESGDGTGEKAERDPLVDELKAKVDLKDAGQLLAFLAAMTTPRGTKLGEEDVAFLLEALGTQEDWGVRNLLFMHLERVGGEAVTAGVLAYIENEKNPAAMIRALQTLRLQNDEAAVNGLVKLFTEAGNRKVREVAFRSLLQTKNGSATDSLLEVLGRTQDPATKRYALAALSQLGGERGAEAVLLYATSTDPAERALGQKGLRDLKSPEAVPTLTNALRTYADPALRQQVTRSLGQIGDPRAVAPLSEVARAGENRGIRYEAMRSLARIGRAEAIPSLQQIAAEDQDKNVRRAASRTITVIERREQRRADRQAHRAANGGR